MFVRCTYNNALHSLFWAAHLSFSGEFIEPVVDDDDEDVVDCGGDIHGSVTFMPKILPGGSASSEVPVSL